jgi:hypothetical protein
MFGAKFYVCNEGHEGNANLHVRTGMHEGAEKLQERND